MLTLICATILLFHQVLVSSTYEVLMSFITCSHGEKNQPPVLPGEGLAGNVPPFLMCAVLGSRKVLIDNK